MVDSEAQYGVEIDNDGPPAGAYPQVFGSNIEIVNIMATLVAETARPPLPRLAQAEGPAPVAGERIVVFDRERRSSPVHRREALLAGHRVRGPALDEEPASVTVLPPGFELEVDPFGNLEVHAP